MPVAHENASAESVLAEWDAKVQTIIADHVVRFSGFLKVMRVWIGVSFGLGRKRSGSVLRRLDAAADAGYDGAKETSGGQ